jgi:hypothetical protein
MLETDTRVKIVEKWGWSTSHIVFEINKKPKFYYHTACGRMLDVRKPHREKIGTINDATCRMCVQLALKERV